MNLQFLNSNFPDSVISGSACLAAIVFFPSAAFAAKSSQEIAQYAKTITVQVNRPAGFGPGSADDGSGFIIKREGNTYIVLTCNHVVNPLGSPKPARVRTSDGISYPINPGSVKSLGTNTNGSNDLALFTFTSDKNYPVAELRSPNQAQLGSKAFISGYPVNNDLNRIAENRVYDFQSGTIWKSRDASLSDGGYSLQYVAQTIGGMSGGPVLDVDAKVIGVHGKADTETDVKQLQSGKELKTDIKLGISAAIPIERAIILSQQIGISELKVDSSASTDNPTARMRSPQDSNDFLARGLSQTNNNRTAAINDFSQAIALDPKNSMAYYNRGNTRYDMGDKQGALADYNEAIRFNPYHANAYYNRGVVRYYLGDKQGAIADFTVALRFSPDDIFAYYSRGSVFRSMKDGRGAFADFDQVVRLAPHLPESYYNRALARAFFNDRQGIIADFTQAIALNPRFSNAYINRSLIIRRLGQIPAAIQDLNTVLSYEPNNAIAIYQRGLFRRDAGDRQGAFADLQRAAELFQQARDTVNYQKAMYAIQRLLSSPPTLPPSQPNYGQPDGEITPDRINEPI
ncbi:serine protease [Sphaerospermopsis aphanizomenoides BCCUSP55]|uniref:tetratricopeptide repeat-containing S1 family peptidase n=1 Tax=Sphaerospermopsis aphanizomenoides TaxID=459663 RepID=UPI001904F22C|nr:tetratricopeptide repeat-containing serine protease family protein [Sphaerospermopsis aphanizomenoides]MBK1986752.1 serine protease [Sphaerospermopsis aphanizomenoides BCCUSP55]